MIDDQLTPEEQHLIEQLQATPKAKLAPSARDAIRQQMVSEFRTIRLPGQPPATPISSRARLALYAAAALAAAVVIVGISLVVMQGSGGTPTATILPGSQVAVMPSATPLPASTAMVTPSPAVSPPATLVVVEGPITSIVDNVVTVFDLPIEVEPQHPILSIVEVGDVIRVEGSYSSGGIVASMVSNIPSETVEDTGIEATVNLEGPVEAIEGSLITVNGIPVQVDPDDLLLQSLQVGNFVSVQGNFEGSASTIVLVVVNITIVNNVVIEGNPLCWYHEGMGMGHWHCDGMGMGMGDPAGMGDAMGMGG